MQKTLITHAREGRIRTFTGYVPIFVSLLFPYDLCDEVFVLAKYIFFKAGTRPQLLCPIKKLVDKLVARGISKRGGSDDSL